MNSSTGGFGFSHLSGLKAHNKIIPFTLNCLAGHYIGKFTDIFRLSQSQRILQGSSNSTRKACW